MKFRSVCLLLALALFLPTISGAAENSDVGISGSQEAIADGPFTFTDIKTGANVYVFESARNEERRNGERIEELRYYIAPAFAFVLPDKTDVTVLSDIAIFKVNVQTYNDGILDQALENIRGKLAPDFRSRLSRSNLSRMNHRAVSFDVRSIPGVEILPLGRDQNLGSSIQTTP